MTKEEAKTWFNNLADYGCESGMIPEMIYYTHTERFYDRHMEAISGVLAELMNEVGATSPAELFGTAWDESDPLAAFTQNKNLLAWFAFEETAKELKLEILTSL